MFWGVPLSVALVFLFVLGFEGGGPNEDLQVCSDRRVRPGRPMAVRSFLFEKLGTPSGPELRTAPATAQMVCGGAAVANAFLSPSLLPGMEGQLMIPNHVEGDCELWLSATLRDGRDTRVVRSLQVALGAEAPALKTRPLALVHQLHHGLIEPPNTVHHPGLGTAAREDLRPPERLEVRIVGGACVPEQRCDVLVLVEGDGFSPSIVPSSSVSILSLTQSAVAPESETNSASMIRAVLTTHGPEAVTKIEALRSSNSSRLEPEGTPSSAVALSTQRWSRSVQLSVVLAARAVTVPAVLMIDTEPLSVQVSGMRHSAVLLDLFEDGRFWRSSRSFALASEGPSKLLWPSTDPLPIGLVRLQVRTDPYSAEHAGVRLFWRHAAADSKSESLDRLVDVLQDRDLSEPDAALVHWFQQERTAPFSEDWMAAWLLSPLESRLVAQPLFVSGAAQGRDGGEAARMRRRTVGGGLILLGGLILAGTVLRRGFAAERRARELMRAVDVQSARGALNRSPASVIFVALLVFGAFAAAALLLNSRSLW
ncbi:MAG: hypothetical protein AAF550_04370 [Myxococcota bacterium]